MSEGSIDPRRYLSPERVALVAAVLLVTVVVASGPSLGSAKPSLSPDTGTSPSGFPAATPSAVPGALLLAGAIDFDGQLLDLQVSLQKEIATEPPDAAALASLLRQVDATVRKAIEVATRLQAAQGLQSVGGRLLASYQALLSSTLDVLRGPPGNATLLRTGAGKVVDAIAPLVPLTAELRDLLGPTPSAPSESASPGGASPSPSGFVEQLLDPGFDQAVGGPWKLQLAPGTWATVTSDPAVKVAGTASARVDIGTPSTSWSGIAVVQPGLRLTTGGLYQVGIALRAADTRNVRVRIASAAGDTTYATRLVTADQTWSTATFEFTALVPDTDASFEIDLGRATPSVWLDNAAFGQISAPPGP